VEGGDAENIGSERFAREELDPALLGLRLTREEGKEESGDE
jgi:hypothetical protein